MVAVCRVLPPFVDLIHRKLPSFRPLAPPLNTDPAKKAVLPVSASAAVRPGESAWPQAKWMLALTHDIRIGRVVKRNRRPKEEDR